MTLLFCNNHHIFLNFDLNSDLNWNFNNNRQQREKCFIFMINFFCNISAILVAIIKRNLKKQTKINVFAHDGSLTEFDAIVLDQVKQFVEELDYSDSNYPAVSF